MSDRLSIQSFMTIYRELTKQEGFEKRRNNNNKNKNNKNNNHKNNNRDFHLERWKSLNMITIVLRTIEKDFHK